MWISAENDALELDQWGSGISVESNAWKWVCVDLEERRASNVEEEAMLLVSSHDDNHRHSPERKEIYESWNGSFE